jgi:hypothetical protein
MPGIMTFLTQSFDNTNVHTHVCCKEAHGPTTLFLGFKAIDLFFRQPCRIFKGRLDVFALQVGVSFKDLVTRGSNIRGASRFML